MASAQKSPHEPDDLHCIVYVSSAVRKFSREDLDNLLATSRANNGVDDITGCLLYADGNFMQVLEGPAGAVHATFARIGASRRHSQVTLILDAPATAREFPTWSMAFDRPGAAQLFALREAFASRAAPPARAFGLLKQFWANQR